MSTCAATQAVLSQPISAKVHYLLSGTFNTIFLYLLAFNPTTSSLTVHKKIKGEGPHQFLALNGRRDRAYATTWGQPASLSAWQILGGGRDGIEHLNTVPITATGSYIQVSSELPRIYSAGGPTGEVHEVDEKTGGFGKKLQELLYVEKEELEKADKTRVALRYGSHSIDLSVRKQAFVPHLGHNSIFMYNVKEDGTLDFIANCPSFGNHDGPRHVVPSMDGSKLYAVTEHTSFVDVYNINANSLTHLQRLDILPPGQFSATTFTSPTSSPLTISYLTEKRSTRPSYRGDTLRLSQDGRFIYVTTRGMTSATRGFLTIWSVSSEDGTLVSSYAPSMEDEVPPLTRYETATSGGKANAVETFPFHPNTSTSTSKGGRNEKDWIALTDDQDGWVWVLEWDGKEVREVAGVRLGEGEEGEEKGVGASHAVWLS